MFKKIKTTLACCSALMMLCAVPLNANAAEEVKINDAASVAVGDTFTYSMYIADASKDVMGMQAYVFYDTDYLEIDTDSINFDNLNGVIYNGNLDGYMTFNFSDISNYASFSSRTQLVSMNFKVKKSGNTNVTYFIKETNQASKNGINFTDKETDAILEVLKADMSPEEIKRIDTIKRMVSMLGKRKKMN